MPRVSIIVPNYNHARFLPQRIESVLQQTFTDFELIILDDASTDNSSEIIQRYLGDPRVRFLPNPTNSGSPFVQWNRGVALAKAPLVWLAESDDYAEPTLLSTLVALLDAHPSVGLAYCQSWRVDDQGAKHGTLDAYVGELGAEHWQVPFVAVGREECARYLLWKNTIPNASGVVFRRDLFRQVGGAPTDLRLAGDWLVWARLLLVSDVAFTPEPLNHFRHHPRSQREGIVGRNSFDEYWRVQQFIADSAPIEPAARRQLAGLAVTESLTRIRGAARGRSFAEIRAAGRRFGPWLLRHPRATAGALADCLPFGRFSRYARRRLVKPGRPA